LRLTLAKKASLLTSLLSLVVRQGERGQVVVGALVDIDARLLEKILAVAVLRNLN
jgi:hypothetical protein